MKDSIDPTNIDDTLHTLLKGTDDDVGDGADHVYDDVSDNDIKDDDDEEDDDGDDDDNDIADDDNEDHMMMIMF